VAELDLGEGSTTAGIVDDLLDNTTGVSVGLSIVEGTELGRGLVETGVGRCKKKKNSISALHSPSQSVCGFQVIQGAQFVPPPRCSSAQPQNFVLGWIFDRTH
jgi:hypothetical protein